MLASNFVEELWYGKHPLSLVLLPLSWLYRVLAAFRYSFYQSGLLNIDHATVPVIIVGNISVGGNGKTPLVIWLANYLGNKGYHPGVVCSGYGGNARHWPQQVRKDSDPAMVGDEAVVIAGRTNCPVAVSPRRYLSIEGLVNHHQCDIFVCDDGLQQYRLARDIEIVVVDGTRRHGNQRLLPAGPLREPVSRLAHVDMIVCNGLHGRGEYQMKFVPQELRSVNNDEQQRNIESFKMEKVHALAGIGNPKRFFQMLRKSGLNIIEHPFPDHHNFKANDLEFNDALSVIMTEKDAVKCRGFANNKCWYLPIEVEMGNTFTFRLESLLSKIYD